MCPITGLIGKQIQSTVVNETIQNPVSQFSRDNLINIIIDKSCFATNVLIKYAVS